MLSKVRSVLVDFSGIWATLVIIASLLNITIDLNNSVWRYVIIGLLLLLLAGNIFRSRKQLRSAQARRVMDVALGGDQSKLEKNVDASIVRLPSQKVLESAYFLLAEHARQWSEDVVIGSFSFMNSYHGGMKPMESFDLTYSSSWKDLSCRASVGNYMVKGEVSESFEKHSLSQLKIVPVERPFFEIMPGWRKALQTAVESISEELEGVGSIVVSMYDSTSYLYNEANRPKTSIYVRYDKGRMKNSKHFEFDGVTLTDTYSNKKITIK